MAILALVLILLGLRGGMGYTTGLAFILAGFSGLGFAGGIVYTGRNRP